MKKSKTVTVTVTVRREWLIGSDWLVDDRFASGEYPGGPLTRDEEIIRAVVLAAREKEKKNA